MTLMSLRKDILFKRKLLTAGSIILTWVIAGAIVTIHEFLFLTNYPGAINTSEMAEYNFLTSLVAAIIWGVMGGSIFALLELFYMQKKLQDMNFINVVLIKALVYSGVLVLINVMTSLLYNTITLGQPIWSKEVWNSSAEYVLSISFWHPVTPFIIVLIITLFLIQLNYKFGPGELWKYVTGAYFSPSEEHRIFLFLDITSSTAIAEELGHVAFFNLINQFYKDITDDIIASGGEIVDYVGDQIIVCWKLETGLRDSNALKCIFNIEQTLEDQRDHYQETYGLLPAFRSGLHMGEATVGEIGKFKREITFFGDVMNTTARIQELCKVHGKKIVVSEVLAESLPLNNYHYEDLGEVSLRGKQQAMKVFSIEE